MHAVNEHIPVESEVFYDALAKGYGDISKHRMPYLDGIDAIVIRKAEILQPKDYLDIGCGDGRKTLKIGAALGVTSPLGIDESQLMISKSTGLRTEHASILEMDIGKRFDLITALWNVIGHVPNDDRGKAFTKIRDQLNSGGALMLDVNNRYNVAAYGQQIVDANKVVDESGGNSGDVTALHEVDGKTLATIGHVFHPDEVDEIVEDTPGLEVHDKLYVNYATGEIVESANEGQVFYEIIRV